MPFHSQRSSDSAFFNLLRNDVIATHKTGTTSPSYVGATDCQILTPILGALFVE